jgi:integron cassette protein
MPIRANDVETLHDFAVGVMARAGRQTTQVRAIALAMLGGIIWRVDPGSIEIRFQDQGRSNDLRWVSVTGYEYSCTYNQRTDQIEVRDRNGHGSVLHNFSNATPIAEVERIFSTL